MTDLDALIASLPDARSTFSPEDLLRVASDARKSGYKSFGVPKVGGGELTITPEIAEGGMRLSSQPQQAPGMNIDAMIAVLPSVKAEPVGQGQAALIAGGAGLDKMAAGLRQAAPAPMRSIIDQLGSSLGMGQPPSIDPAARAADAARLSGMREQYPMTTGLAEAGPTLAAKSPLGMAALAALGYGTPTERATEGVGAFAGGKAGQYAGSALSRILQPVRGAGNAAMDATKELFSKYNVQGLPSQIAGSRPLGWIESTLASLPGGGRLRELAGAQQGALNQAGVRAMGGEGAALTPEVARTTLAATGAQIGDITSAVPSVRLDKPLYQALNDVRDRYANKLDALQKPIVATLIDEIKAQGNTMTGAFYQQTRSDISRMAHAASGAYENALTGIYKALDRAFDRSAPSGVADAVKAARLQYRTGKTLEPMATAMGDISPARLAASAKTLPTEHADLALFASKLKALPSSGTMERLAYQGLLTGGMGGAAGLATGDPKEAAKYAAASLALPWLASQAITRAPFRNYLTGGLLRVSPEAEKLLRRTGQGFGGLLGQDLAQ